MSTLNSVYEKEYDPDTDSWFYVNKVRHLKFCHSTVRHGPVDVTVICGF